MIPRKRFWMFLEIELRELLPRFEKIFQIDNLYRDYENVWEWLESKDGESEFYINISRSHDWEKGNYGEPISMIIEDNSNEPFNEDEIGKKLLEEFNTTVYFGELEKGTGGKKNYSSKVEKTFSGNFKKEEILNELDKIDFHDIPVEGVRIVSDPEILIVVSFFLYLEEWNDYQKIEIIFKVITQLEIGNILLDSESDIEIYSFDYKLEEEFDCKMTFLLGFEKPSFEMKIKCKEIEMKTVPNKV